MKIVIIGDGKVGYKLAKQLSSEKYDIILIDNNEEKLRKSIERMDVFCVAGEGGSVEVQQRADVPHADLVIACTSTDECNMLSCLIARRLGARHTIARVRNPIYYKQIDFLKKDLHLSMVVNPELIVAGDITRLLLFPDASKVETFVKGRVELVEFPIHCGKLEGLSLSESYARFQVQDRKDQGLSNKIFFFYKLFFCQRIIRPHSDTPVIAHTQMGSFFRKSICL